MGTNEVKCPNCEHIMNRTTVGLYIAKALGVDVETDEEFWCENCQKIHKSGRKVIYDGGK